MTAHLLLGLALGFVLGVAAALALAAWLDRLDRDDEGL